MSEIPAEYVGWWHIIETSQWPDDELDICGAALLSLAGVPVHGLRGELRRG